MDILSAIKREERKLEKQVASIHHKLKGIKAAAEALQQSANKKVTKGTKRVLSAAARAKIAKAAKKRWAKFRAEAKKMAG
jgi:peptidoglycan hydrolase CwlO-like protein